MGLFFVLVRRVELRSNTVRADAVAFPCAELTLALDMSCSHVLTSLESARRLSAGSARCIVVDDVVLLER